MVAAMLAGHDIAISRFNAIPSSLDRDQEYRDGVLRVVEVERAALRGRSLSLAG